MARTSRQNPDTNQVVEVRYGDKNNGKTYSYVGSGNLRAGQVVNNAPVTHPVSGKNYVTKAVVVATHNVYGANVGDMKGVQNGMVTSIPKPLKYLVGDKELLQNRELTAFDDGTTANEYLSQYTNASIQDRLGRFISQNDNAEAIARLKNNF